MKRRALALTLGDPAGVGPEIVVKLENHDVDPATEAQSIQGVIWSSTERHWATGASERDEVRRRALRFCLRGLGVRPETIDNIVRT